MAKDKDKTYPEKFEDTDQDASNVDCNGNCNHCVDEAICDKADDEYYDFGAGPDEDFDDFCDDEYLDGDFDYDDMQGYV